MDPFPRKIHMIQIHIFVQTQEMRRPTKALDGVSGGVKSTHAFTSLVCKGFRPPTRAAVPVMQEKRSPAVLQAATLYPD